MLSAFEGDISLKESTLSKSLIRIAIAAVLVLLSVLSIWLRSKEKKPDLTGYSVEVIPPTCTDGGYSLYTNPDTGEVIMEDLIPAAGHKFGPWEIVTEATLLTPGSRSRVCESCGECETSRAYYDGGISVIALEGSLDGIAKKVEVPMQASLFMEEGEIVTYASLKHQGHSSLHFPKKNYTLKLWKDDQLTEKNKLTFSHWNKENKYILKADYLDPTMCRNLICADVWADVVASREDLPENFTELSNYGAVDGIPALLYINGEFQGIYNMNLHKDDDLFGMEEDEYHAVMITNDPTASEAFFKGQARFTGDSPWEVEFCGTEDETWAKDKLNELIRFVMESDDATFRKELHKYLDVDSAIDYLLSMYVLGLCNHGADELILVCYSADDPWICSMYDMETGFGLSSDGKTFLPAETFLPGEDSATDNLLWDRLLRNFRPELMQRYTQLRQTVFTPDALKARVADFTAPIPKAAYEANDALHEGYPAAQTGLAQMADYIEKRIELTDKLFLSSEE